VVTLSFGSIDDFERFEYGLQRVNGEMVDEALSERYGTLNAAARKAWLRGG